MNADTISPRQLRKVLIASLMGTTIEWYDYFLYGTMTALVFNKLFFPTEDPVVGTLIGFASFAVAFFIRPLGGLIFSHFGDKLGRKRILILSLAIMGGATGLMGLLPTYDTIGILAPILLISLRLIQGLALGGEWGGAVLLAIEYAPKGKRGFFGSWPQMGSPLGMLLGTLTLALLTGVLSNSQFLAWGWRIPFILSVLLVFIGLWIRKGIDETPAFKEAQKAAKKKAQENKFPIVEAIKNHKKSLLISLGLKSVETGPYFILTVWIITYATAYLGHSYFVALMAVTLGALFCVCLYPFIGKLSDKTGRKPLFITSTIAVILYAFPYFFLMDLGSVAILWISSIIAFLLWAPCGVLIGTIYSEIFSTEVRYTGLSFGYMVGGALFGGLTPFMATLLIDSFNDSWVPIALFIIVLGTISLITLLLTPETKDIDLDFNDIDEVKEETENATI